MSIQMTTQIQPQRRYPKKPRKNGFLFLLLVREMVKEMVKTTIRIRNNHIISKNLPDLTTWLNQ